MFKDPHPLEMFRRALVEKDLQAREWLQHSYHKTVLDWLQVHPRKEEALRCFSEQYYVSQTFIRLWQVADGDACCNSLPTVLKYLHVSLNGVLMDALRASSHLPPRPEKSAGDYSELWETLQGLITGGREKRLTYLLYHCGLQPAEIVRACPREFSDVQEIFHLRFNILERLLQNKAAIAQLQVH